MNHEISLDTILFMWYFTHEKGEKMKKFITVSRSDFENILPANTQRVSIPGAYELVYDIPTKTKNLVVRIYSTVDSRTGVTRDKGTDAIRCVLFDTLNNRPLNKGKKILRVEGATTIQDRIKSRVEDLLSESKAVTIIDYSHVLDADPDYVEFILNHPLVKNNSFGQSLGKGFKQYGSLTKKQLVWVLGKENPRGYPTFEEMIKEKDPEYLVRFLEKGEEETVKDESLDDIILLETSVPVTKAEDIQIVKTSEYDMFQYPFEYFNPVQSLVFPKRNDDSNLVLSANTSAGKTIAAELLMDGVLKRGKRIIYLSPYKSLTEEKFADWTKRFEDHNISILTGDHFLSEKQKDELAKTSIYCLTSEMMDSRTRKIKSEKNYWLMDVELVIVDESHILTTDRGHPVETGIMRFTKLNTKARIVFLSATMPNVGELGEWLTVLNGKKTEVLYTDWRPVELQLHMVGYNAEGRYADNQGRKIGTVVNIISSKSNEKFLVFVHSKNEGRIIENILKRAGENVMFHNADLDLSERKVIEDSFRDKANGIRVLISTSTLAWGSIEDNTPILLTNGSEVNAGILKVGQDIVSFNEETKKTEQDVVVDIKEYYPVEEIEMELENGSVLRVDRKHPFYVKTKDGVIQKEAEFLTEEDELVSFGEI